MDVGEDPGAHAVIDFPDMTAFRVIAMPYELGRLRDGVGRGPERLLEAGAADALASAGAQVATEAVTFDGRVSSEVNTSFDLIGQISERVGAALADGAFPVILSGSCFAAVGVMAGLAEPSPGVVWLDAHADFNTPDSTVYGYFDGMGLAIITGGAWRSMRAAVPGAGPIPEQAVVLAGARDLDENERARLRESKLTHLPIERLEGPDAVVAAVESITPSGLYLHVDLDVLDPEDGRANIYAAPGGLRAEQLEAIVVALLERFPVRALSLTAYDPDVDPEGKVPPIALRLLRRLAAARG
jgi:arginase